MLYDPTACLQERYFWVLARYMKSRAKGQLPVVATCKSLRSFRSSEEQGWAGYVYMDSARAEKTVARTDADGRGRQCGSGAVHGVRATEVEGAARAPDPFRDPIPAPTPRMQTSDMRSSFVEGAQATDVAVSCHAQETAWWRRQNPWTCW